MRLLPAALFLACVTAAAAEGIQEWRTPDGRLFFGDNPPKGSVALKKVDKQIGTVSTPPDLLPPAVPGPVRYTWRQGVGCAELGFTGVKQEPFEGIPRTIVQGTVTHDGRHLVKDVQVCAAGVCDGLRDGSPMRSGDSEPFYLDVPSGGPIALAIECSVNEPAS
jgi:hypothetical protein